MRKLVVLATVVLAALSLSAGQPSFAGHGKQGQKHEGGGIGKMAQELGLTDAQKTQIATILQTARQQSQAVKADTTLTPEAKKDKLKAIRKDAMTQVRALLTPEQIEKMKQLRHQNKKGKVAPAA